MPTPEITGRDELFLQPEVCPDEARCHKCYNLDKFFAVASIGRSFWQPDFRFPQSCNDFTWGIFDVFPDFGFSYAKPDEEGNTNARRVLFSSCWSGNLNYSCPYDPQIAVPCQESNILLAEPFALANGDPISEAFDTAILVLKGNNWDGTCGKFTLDIQYAVIEARVTGNTLPALPDPEDPDCPELKFTHYKYSFELEYCTCEEMLQPFTFVGVESYDSCFGGVEDPCNTAEAIVSIQKADQICGRCSCLNCVGFSARTLQLDITGPTINGTFILTQDFFRRPDGNFVAPFACEFFLPNTITEEIPCLVFLGVMITCNDCDGFEATLAASTSPIGLYTAKTEPFTCGQSVVFNKDEQLDYDPCQFADHTIQLSFVPT